MFWLILNSKEFSLQNVQGSGETSLDTQCKVSHHPLPTPKPLLLLLPTPSLRAPSPAPSQVLLHPLGNLFIHTEMLTTQVFIFSQPICLFMVYWPHQLNPESSSPPVLSLPLPQRSAHFFAVTKWALFLNCLSIAQPQQLLTVNHDNTFCVVDICLQP